MSLGTTTMMIMNYDEPQSRAEVNEAVRKEQDALKLRAQNAMQMSEEASAYDYDGVYDSFQKETTTEPEKTNDDGENINVDTRCIVFDPLICNVAVHWNFGGESRMGFSKNVCGSVCRGAFQ